MKLTTHPDSAFLSVTGIIGPPALIEVKLRRLPRIGNTQVRRKIQALDGVAGVTDVNHGYLVSPLRGITPSKLTDLMRALCALSEEIR